MICTLLLSSPILSFIYAISVHLFLAFFNERLVTPLRYWRPIIIRLVYVLIIGLITWLWINDNYCTSNPNSFVGSFYLNEMGSSSFFNSYDWVVKLGVCLLNLAISTYLIVDTRCKEVDGPPPVFESFANCDSSDVCGQRNSKRRARSMQNKVVLITGANSGIGLETARQLYNCGATVIFACRSRERAVKAMRVINHTGRYNNEADVGQMYFLSLDLTSISSIRNAAKLFDEMKFPLHVLINNAGVMRRKREETEDGIEVTMAANHFGHFLLTNLLLPKLRQTALEEKFPSKVITLSSSLYKTAVRPVADETDHNKIEFGIDLDDLQCQHKRYTLFDQYSQSKLANILFARELGRREKLRAKKVHQDQNKTTSVESDGAIFCPIYSYSVHPGLVRTDVIRDLPWYLYYPNIVCAVFMTMLQKTPKSGAYTSVFCAIIDDHQYENHSSDTEGYLYINSQVAEFSQAAKSYEDAEKLWKLSCDLMKVSLDE